jgi:hypothetical protein
VLGRREMRDRGKDRSIDRFEIEKCFIFWGSKINFQNFKKSARRKQTETQKIKRAHLFVILLGLEKVVDSCQCRDAAMPC